jgi:hypothetical protein
MKSLFGSDAAVEPGDPPPAGEPVAPAAPVAPPPAEPPAAPEPPAEPDAAPSLSATDIRTAVRDGFRDAMPQTPPPPAAPAAPAEPGFELSPEDDEDIRAMRWAEAKNKLKAGSADAYLAFLKKYYEYQDKWAADNPDKEFDPEDNDIATWIAQNQPEMPERPVIDRWITAMLVDEQVEEKLAPEREALQKEREELKAKAQWDKQVAESLVHVDTKIVQMVEAVNPELAKLLKGADGKPVINAESEAKLEATDSIAHEVLKEEVEGVLKPVLNRLEYVCATCDLLDPTKNPVDRHILGISDHAERVMRSAPTEVQVQDGRQWVSAAEMEKARADITKLQSSDADKKAAWEKYCREHWWFTIAHLEELAVDESAARSDGIIKRRDQIAQKKYAKNGGPPPDTQQNPPQSQPATSLPPSSTTRSFPTNKPPIVGGGSPADSGAPGNPVSTNVKTGGEAVVQRLFHGK